jgi:branched-chain amino acid transport system ATP-binding protein
MTAAAFSIDNLTASYGALVAVRGVSLAFASGGRAGIFGHNGSGKSTLLKCLFGGVKAVSGGVRFESSPIEPGLVHRNVRLGIGVVPQSRNVFPSLSVERCLRVAGLREGNTNLDTVFEMLPALKERRRQRAGLMSGGEQQMLAVGRALARRPRLLLLDELSLGLAPVIVETLLPVVREYAEESGCGVVLVEQHIELALNIADRGFVLSHGEIVLRGQAVELRTNHDLLISSYFGEHMELFTGNRP